jgi:hypothetical protein
VMKRDNSALKTVYKFRAVSMSITYGITVKEEVNGKELVIEVTFSKWPLLLVPSQHLKQNNNARYSCSMQTRVASRTQEIGNAVRFGDKSCRQHDAPNSTSATSNC